MASGPLGIPRPFARQRCNIVIYMRVIGRPREDVSRKMLNLEHDIAQHVIHIPRDGQTVYTNLPSGKRVQNTFDIAVGLPDGFQSGPDVIQAIYTQIRERVLEIGREVWNGYVTADDPQNVIERHA